MKALWFWQAFHHCLLLQHRKKAKPQNQCDPVLSVKGPCDHRAYFSPCSTFSAGRADVTWQGQQDSPSFSLLLQWCQEEIQRLFDKVNQDTITAKPWCCLAFLPMVLTVHCGVRQNEAHSSQKWNMLLRWIYTASPFHRCNCALPQFSKVKRELVEHIIYRSCETQFNLHVMVPRLNWCLMCKTQSGFGGSWKHLVLLGAGPPCSELSHKA